MKHNVFDAKATSGIVDTANVTLGGLCIENQAIELANKLSPQFTSGAGDGLLGLVFGHINIVKPKKVATPVEQVSYLSYLFQSSFFDLSATPFLQAHTPLTPSLQRINQSDIASESELFTRYLGSWRDTSDVDAGESFYTFGYIDESILTRCGVSEPQYVPIDSSRGF
ncbi:hypothetical protein J4E91_001841 [Alternaria rosae]|nr:hypothetical protein J4E91_001841 [Alternaria rosae]